MNLSNIDLGNVQGLSKDELNQTTGGFLILAVAGVALAYAAIGAAICWSMAEDNREC